ncbi:MAG: murein biosynthesis integral membrane protein MurJ [Chloroflexota bacterium]
MFRNSKLIQASVLVIVLSGLNKITGFIKLYLSTEAFGTGADADAMAAAWQLPDVFFVMVSGGTMAAALIPVYSATLVNRDKEYQQKLANTVLTAIALILGTMCVTAAIFAPWLARVVIVPDFAPEQQILTANLMRIALFGMFLFGLSSILVSILHSHQHFLAPALGAALFDSGFVIGLWMGADSYGVYAMVWGGVLGIVMHLIAQLVMIRRYDLSLWPQLDFSLPEVREILHLIWPRLVVLVSLESVDIVIVRLASALPEGSTSAWFFANLLINMPVDLFGWSLVVTFFPTLSQEYNSENIDKLHHSLEAGLRYLWFLIVPSFVGLIALGPAGVSVLMERGEFTADSTRLVYSLLVIAASGAICLISYEILAMLFYARHNTFYPMVIQLISIAIGIGATYALVGPWGIYGLASGRLVYTAAIMISTWLIYRWLFEPLNEKLLAQEFIRSLIAAGAMALAIRLVAQIEMNQLIFVVLAIPLGVLVYGMVHYFSGSDTLLEILEAIQDRRRNREQMTSKK